MESWTSMNEAMAGVRASIGCDMLAYAGSNGAGADSMLYKDLPAQTYHADRDSLSCSMLKPLLLSPAHFQHSLVAQTSGSAAKDFGSLVHLILLEPQKVGIELAVFPGVGSARDKDFKAFELANRHRLAVDEPTFRTALLLAEKTAGTLFRGRALAWFIEESMRECSVYFTEPVTGLRLRTRFDAYHPDISFDLKTTRHPTSQAFARDAVEFGYDLQAYMYSLARSHYEGSSTLAPFVFITAETAAPHSICTHVAGTSFMENGESKLQKCLAVFKACSLVGHWPDLSCHTTLEISPWQQFVREQEWNI
jgi:hypothetical protein